MIENFVPGNKPLVAVNYRDIKRAFLPSVADDVLGRPG